MSEALTLKDFAASNEISMRQVLYCCKKGWILGANQHRNGQWFVYPPAMLIQRPRPMKEREAKRPSLRAVPLSGTGVMAASCHVDTYPTGKDSEAAMPLLVDAFKGLGLVVSPGEIEPESEERSSEAPRLSGAVPEVFNRKFTL